MNVIVAQRLARRLCGTCRESYESDGMVFRGDTADGPPIDVPPTTLWRSTGCAACAGVGYQGRVAFYEILDLSGSMRQHVGGPTQQLQQAAFEAGHKSLAQDGLRLCLEGTTSIEEIARTTGSVVEPLEQPPRLTEEPAA